MSDNEPSLFGLSKELRKIVFTNIAIDSHNFFWLDNGMLKEADTPLAKALPSTGTHGWLGREMRKLLQLHATHHFDLERTIARSHRQFQIYNDELPSLHGIVHTLNQGNGTLKPKSVSLQIQLNVPIVKACTDRACRNYACTAHFGLQYHGPDLAFFFAPLLEMHHVERIILEIATLPEVDDSDAMIIGGVHANLWADFGRECESEARRAVTAMPALQEYSYCFDNVWGGWAKKDGAGNWPAMKRDENFVKDDSGVNVAITSAVYNGKDPEMGGWQEFVAGFDMNHRATSQHVSA